MIPFPPQPKFKVGETAYLRNGTAVVIHCVDITYEYGVQNEIADNTGEKDAFPCDERNLLTPAEYMIIKDALDDLPF